MTGDDMAGCGYCGDLHDGPCAGGPGGDRPTVSLRKPDSVDQNSPTVALPSGSWPAAAPTRLGAPPPLPGRANPTPDGAGGLGGSPAPWSPGAPPPTPRPSSNRAGGRRLAWLGVAAGGVLAVGVTTGIVLSSHDETGPDRSAHAPAGSPIGDTATSGTDTVAMSTASVSSDTPVPTPTPTPTEIALPVTVTPMTLIAVRDDPRAAAVAELLDTYFTGINNHDPEQAASAFASDGVIDPDDPDAVAQFGRAIRTTRDDLITVTAIRSARYDGRAGALVSVRFRSRQAPSLGPDGQACTRWSLDYRTVGDTTALLLLKSVNVVSRGC